jgi:hypothetical protein
VRTTGASGGSQARSATLRPFEAVTATPLHAIATIVVLLLVGGFTWFRHRDLGS